MAEAAYVQAASVGQQPSAALTRVIVYVNTLEGPQHKALAKKLGAADEECDTDDKTRAYLQLQIAPLPTKKNILASAAKELEAKVKAFKDGLEQPPEPPNEEEEMIQKLLDELKAKLDAAHMGRAEEARIMGEAEPRSMEAAARALLPPPLPPSEAPSYEEALDKLVALAFKGQWEGVAGTPHGPDIKGEAGVMALGRLMLAKPAPPAPSLAALKERGAALRDPAMSATRLDELKQEVQDGLAAYIRGLIDLAAPGASITAASVQAKALEVNGLGARLAAAIGPPSAAPVTVTSLARAAAQAAVEDPDEQGKPIKDMLDRCKTTWWGLCTGQAAANPAPAAAPAGTPAARAAAAAARAATAGVEEPEVTILEGGGRAYSVARHATLAGAQAAKMTGEAAAAALARLKYEKEARDQRAKALAALAAAAIKLGKPGAETPATSSMPFTETRAITEYKAMATGTLTANLGAASFTNGMVCPFMPEGLGLGPGDLESPDNLYLVAGSLTDAIREALHDPNFDIVTDVPAVVKAHLQRALHALSALGSGLTAATFWSTCHPVQVQMEALEEELQVAHSGAARSGGGLYVGLLVAVLGHVYQMACFITNTAPVGEVKKVAPSLVHRISTSFAKMAVFLLTLAGVCGVVPARPSAELKELFRESENPLPGVLAQLGGAARAASAAGKPSHEAAAGGGGGAGPAAAAPSREKESARVKALTEQLEKLKAKLGKGEGAAAAATRVEKMVAPAGGKKIPAVLAVAGQSVDKITAFASTRQGVPRPCNYCGKADCPTKHAASGHDAYYSLPTGTVTRADAHAAVKAQLA
jgi:hypothetical protein